MFTERFIVIPTKVFDTEEKNLTGKETYVDVDTRINPFHISYYEASDAKDDKDNFIYTLVHLSNGVSMIAYMSIELFEQKLNTFFGVV